MSSSILSNPNAGVMLLPGSTFIVGVTAADQKRLALVGCHPDQAKELVGFGVHILVNGYPKRRAEVEQAILTEISARLSVGLDSEVAGNSMLALVMLYLEITGRLAETLNTTHQDALAFQLGHGAKTPVTIAPSSPPEIILSFLGDDGSIQAVWAGEERAPSDLLIHIEDEERGLGQSLILPRSKARSLIRKSERQFSMIAPRGRMSCIMTATLGTIRSYHQSLAGLAVAVPASKWDWRSARALLSGHVAWLLREQGLLEEALSYADDLYLHVGCSNDKWKLLFKKRATA